MTLACAVENPLFGFSASGGGDGDGTGASDDSGTAAPLDGAGQDGSGSGGASGDGGTPGLGFLDDEWPGEFGAGQHNAVEWSTDNLRLAGDVTDGHFLSRVFDAGATVQWSTIQWWPESPYRKPIPDDGVSESGYVSGNIDMTGIHQVFHFDGDAVEDAFADTSGHDHDATLAGSPGLSLVEGLFGQALSDQVDGSSVDLRADLFAPGTEDFTWAFWYRSDVCTDDLLISFDSNEDIADTPSVWIVCDVCQDGNSGLSFGAYGPFGDFQCAPVGAGDGTWHHLALVKAGHANATVVGFFDGEPVVEQPVGFTVPLIDEADVEFFLGGNPEPPYTGRGDFDELAIWRRALAPSEVRALYERGTHRLRLRARACENPDCSDGEFVGPNGAPSGFFRETPNVPDAPQPRTLPDLVGRFAQYEVEFAGGGQSPALHAVELRTE